MQEAAERGIPQELAAKWAARYGANVDRLLAIAAEMSASGAPAASADSRRLPLEVAVPLRYALEAEMAMTPADFFVRRTGALMFDIAWVRRWKEPVTMEMTRYFGWSEEVKRRWMAELDRALEGAVVPKNPEGIDGISG
ncbi:Aerobic glycerol-3-phosphate dehydrogenase [compost metagenome]